MQGFVCSGWTGARALAATAALVLLPGCLTSAVNPPNSRFTPVAEGLDLSPRKTITLATSKNEIDDGTHVFIGSVETSLLVSRCNSDVGTDGCASTGRTRGDALAAALAKAEKAGGDIALVTRSFREDEYSTRNGSCASYTTSTERVSTYRAGDSSTSSATKTVSKCARYEQVRVRSTYQRIALDVFRAEQGLGERIEEAQSLLAAKAAGEAEARRARQREAVVAARAATAARAAAAAEREAFSEVLRSGSQAEVTQALSAKPAFRGVKFRHPPLSSNGGDTQVDIFRYAIANLNVEAVRALLAAGFDPNGAGWKRQDPVPPPLWQALLVYRYHNACASWQAGEPPSGFVDDYRTPAGEHKAVLIIRDLINAGADTRSAAPGKSALGPLLFGYDAVQNRRFIRAFANVGKCQREREQAELLDLVIDFGGYDPAAAAETVRVLQALADDWETRLLPEDEAMATSDDDPRNRAYGAKMVAMRRSVITEARHLIKVLNARR